VPPKSMCFSAVILLICTMIAPNAGVAESLNDFLTRTSSRPDISRWKPESERLASLEELTNPVIPTPDRFTNLHGGLRSTDEVNIVFAPVFERTWTAETGAFVPESPTFDRSGDAYFVPLFPTEDGQNMLIKLNGETGAREWAITRDMVGDTVLNLPILGLTTFPATLGQGGAPLVLNDPDTGDEVIYSGSYSRVYAADTDGNILWSVPGIPISLLVHRAIPPGTHLFGVNYHPATDTILYGYGAGDIVAYDRATGRRMGSIFLPGSPATSVTTGGFGANLPEEVRTAMMDLIRETIVESFDVPEIQNPQFGFGSSLVDALLGGGMIISNHFAVDPNTNSIWVASTDLDGADGTVDGVSERGALYRIDLTEFVHPTLGERVGFIIGCHASFEGGTTSTPAVSPDGLRIYTSDNLGQALAFDRDCALVWSVDTGQPAVASLSVSSNVGAEIYYPTARAIIKIKESESRGHAEIQWSADIASSFVGGQLIEMLAPLREALRAGIEEHIGLELPEDFVRFEANNLDLATIGQNGIMVHAGFGVNIGGESSPLLLPIALNNGLYDRKTGAFINATPAIEENIGAMYTGPDGTIAMGSSPVRRAVIRGLANLPGTVAELPPGVQDLIDFVVPPLTGGVTKYGVVQRFDLLARDALCQSMRTIRNTKRYAPGSVGEHGVAADVADTRRMIEQAKEALTNAIEVGELKAPEVESLFAFTATAGEALDAERFGAAGRALRKACYKAKQFRQRGSSGRSGEKTLQLERLIEALGGIPQHLLIELRLAHAPPSVARPRIRARGHPQMGGSCARGTGRRYCR